MFQGKVYRVSLIEDNESYFALKIEHKSKKGYLIKEYKTMITLSGMTR